MTIREELELVKKELLKWTDVQLNLKNRMDELEAKLEEEESKGQDQYWPKLGDTYYFIDDESVVINSSFYNDNCDKARKAIGNFFRTREGARFEVERLKVIAELKRFGRPFNPGTRNHYIAYDHKAHRLYSGHSWGTDHGKICFDSAEKAKEVSEAVGEDRIIKYYFGVVD